jgi:hypothetical protein
MRAGRGGLVRNWTGPLFFAHVPRVPNTPLSPLLIPGAPPSLLLLLRR